MMRCLLPLVLLLASCAGETAVSTTQPVDPPSTSTAAALPTTTTKAAETTTTVGARRVAIGDAIAVAERRNLLQELTYVMAFDGFNLEITPPIPAWVLAEYGQSRAVFVWEGATGSRPGTLEVAIYDVADRGVEAAWSRIEGLEEKLFRDPEWEWAWVERGTAMLGDREVEWREVRLPPVPVDDPEPDNPTALTVTQSNFPVVLGHDASARFYVVPVAGFTVTVLGSESRCVCPGRRSLGRGSEFVDRDVENELSMWIDELEAFLASMEFVES